VLLWALERTLRLLHPMMPFVTEEIWALMPGEERGLLAVAQFPVADSALLDEDAEAELARMIEAVTALRRYRDEVGAKPGATLNGVLAAEGYDGLRGHIGRLSRTALGDAVEGGVEVLATVPIPGGGVQVLPSEAFDPADAQRRLEKKGVDLRKEIERAERKLANEQFVAKAPPEVVEEERRKLGEYREALEGLGS
jgi:valyl-tRNA synthetase